MHQGETQITWNQKPIVAYILENFDIVACNSNKDFKGDRFEAK